MIKLSSKMCLFRWDEAIFRETLQRIIKIKEVYNKLFRKHHGNIFVWTKLDLRQNIIKPSRMEIFKRDPSNQNYTKV